MGELFLYIAVGPAVFLLYYIYRKDRLDREPAKLLAKLLFFGALSAVPAVVLELAGELAMDGMKDSVFKIFIENFFAVAAVEEGCKYLMLKKCTWKRQEFNCSYDGLIYAVYVSMGFAVIENLFYVAEMGIVTGIVRAVTAIPGHCFFGVFMGTHYAEAKRLENLGETAEARRQRFLAFAVATAVHGAYDFLLSVESYAGLALFAVLLVGLYVAGFKSIGKASREDMYIVPGQEEMNAALQRWMCPVCGTENDGILCGYCGWHVPKSGSTLAPVKPEAPKFAPLKVPAAKIPAGRRLRPVFSLLTGFAVPLAVTLMNGSFSKGVGTVTIFLVFAVFIVCTIVLPVVFVARNEKWAQREDTDYRKALEEYREKVRLKQQQESAYSEAVAEWNEYREAAGRAEKKRKKEKQTRPE